MINQIFLQARMGSGRLPGKVLLKIGGKSIIELTVERLKRVMEIDKIIVATSRKKRDEPIVREAKKLGVFFFQGSEENTLDRFYQASLKFKPDNIIRVTGDCPLIDFNLINRGLEIFKKGNYDVLSNCRIRTFPDGMVFEIFKAKALAVAWRDNFLKFNKDKEKFEKTSINPTKYLLEKKKFKNKDLVAEKNLAHIRLTIDYKEDFEVVKIIYQNLCKKNKYFTLEDILKFLKANPKLLDLNKKYIMNYNNIYDKSQNW